MCSDYHLQGRISLIKEFDVKEVLSDGWTPGSFGEQEEEEIDIMESDVASQSAPRKQFVDKRPLEENGIKIKSSRHTRFACVGTLRSKQATVRSPKANTQRLDSCLSVKYYMNV